MSEKLARSAPTQNLDPQDLDKGAEPGPEATVADLTEQVLPGLDDLPVSSLRVLEPLLATLEPHLQPGNEDLVQQTLALLRLVTSDINCLAVALAYVCCGEEQLPDLPMSQEQQDLLRQVRGTEMISALAPKGAAAFSQSSPQVEHLRRMVLDISQDMRVLLIKIAERGGRLHQERGRDRRLARQIAREVFRIHAPIAGRLGFYALKSELEDLCLETLSPRGAKRIEALLARDRAQRSEYIERFATGLHDRLQKAGLACEVSARAKNTYSIYRKLRRKNMDLSSSLCDVYGVRVLVEEISQCYQVLGLVHSWWRHLRAEFDDYIGNAKPNGYRSIHTAVVGPDGETIEVQIRTRRMHEESEIGAAAHGSYKGDRYFNPWYEKRLRHLRQLAADEQGEGSELMERFALDEAIKHIYVYTPDGDTLELPANATVLDCAYAIHTDLGNRCLGGKIDDAQRHSIYRVLRSGERVEILTAAVDMVSEDWLRPDNPAVHTALGRQAVRRALRRKVRGAARDRGEALAMDLLHRAGLPLVSLKEAAGRLSLDGVEELFKRLGEGRISISDLRRELPQTKGAQGKGGAEAAQDGQERDDSGELS